MNDRPLLGPSRVTLAQTSPGRLRVHIDGQAMGPAMSERAARVVRRWLTEGALEDLEGGGGGSKLERALTDVDRAFVTVSDLLKNGLR